MSEQSKDLISLREVLGAVLKEVSDSRFLSDKYSRELSRVYQQDDIMKVFPVPRSEIKELDLELKFAFDEVKKEPYRAEVLDRRIKHIFQLYDNLVKNTIIQSILNFYQKDDFQVLRKEHADEWENICQKLQSNALGIQLEKLINEYFLWGYKRWMDYAVTFCQLQGKDIPEQVEIDTHILAQGLMDLLFRGFQKRDFLTLDDGEKNHQALLNQDFFGAFNLEQGSEKEQIFRSQMINAIVNQLQDMKKRFKRVINIPFEEVNTYVNVSADKLESIDLNKLCTVRIKTTLKNYTWTALDGEESHKLIPD
ncbi:hypothetical protein [Xanthovirga aplysinae]|uniref:hypothetical protein n=1 Tax=Xanthovirga aplysinae TaxID=2529853 RepID=UPI0012BD12CF|nr:hypothetical protein [Xanthovirga aplysinae]MTI32112.1 hypothetical protein [Xanthovirga aplysinae]